MGTPDPDCANAASATTITTAGHDKNNPARRREFGTRRPAERYTTPRQWFGEMPVVRAMDATTTTTAPTPTPVTCTTTGPDQTAEMEKTAGVTPQLKHPSRRRKGELHFLNTKLASPPCRSLP